MPDTLDLKEFIRDVPDFPKPGILFKDITPLLANPEAFQACIDEMVAYYQDQEIDAIVSAEARGFIFAAPLALKLNASFIPVRKPGKLPFDTHSFHYELEYGTDSLEMHTDALKEGDRVLMMDDLLATGGTLGACIEMAERSGAEVIGCAFLIELCALNGRDNLRSKDVFSLIKY